MRYVYKAVALFSPRFSIFFLFYTLYGTDCFASSSSPFVFVNQYEISSIVAIGKFKYTEQDKGLLTFKIEKIFKGREKNGDEISIRIPENLLMDTDEKIENYVPIGFEKIIKQYAGKENRTKVTILSRSYDNPKIIPGKIYLILAEIKNAEYIVSESVKQIYCDKEI